MWLDIGNKLTIVNIQIRPKCMRIENVENGTSSV